MGPPLKKAGWTDERVVAEARRVLDARLGEDWDPTDRRVWNALAPLIASIGWTEDEVIDALQRHFETGRLSQGRW
jgi:hypothetical protein